MIYQESLARKFHPAGFDQPEGSRRNYVRPRRELQYAFDKWLNELTEHSPVWKDRYEKACESVMPIGEIPYREANSLLADFNPKTSDQIEAGLFISACYIHSPESTIIFDLYAPQIWCIGYKTNKNIFNNGIVGKYFAFLSSGLSIDNDECGVFFALRSSGIALGATGPRGYGHIKIGRTIKPAHWHGIPELKTYFEELRDVTNLIKDNESAKIFLEKYGPNPKERIEMEIREIVGEDL